MDSQPAAGMDSLAPGSKQGPADALSLASTNGQTNGHTNGHAGESTTPPPSSSIAPASEDTRFHSTFPAIPESEHLIATYSCALQREILVQGHLFISEKHLSFKASIFGWKTMLCLGLEEIGALRKTTTVGLFRNGLEVRTADAKHGFVSLLKRDETYDELVHCWKGFHPEATVYGEGAREGIRDLALCPSTSSTAPSTASDGEDEEVMSARSGFSGFSKRRGSTTLEKAAAGVRTKLNGLKKKSVSEGADESSETEAQKVAGRYRHKRENLNNSSVHKVTECPCGKNGDHYDAVAMDVIFPTDMEKLYGLFFSNHEFLIKFMEEKEKLTQLHLGEWENIDAGDDGLKKRNMDYIKPLHGSIGPKETLCKLLDENISVDFDDYVSNTTTTTTPNVPAGSQFKVKTRTCLTYAEGGGVRALVTTGVEWSKVNRLLKGVIERSAIEGQKSYHADLDVAIRGHISANKEEYETVGIANTAKPSTAPTTARDLSTLSAVVEKLGGLYATALLVLLVLVSMSHWRIWTRMVRYRAMTAHGWSLEHTELVRAAKELEEGYAKLRVIAEGLNFSASGNGH